MKTTKLILAIAFLAFSTLAFSQTERTNQNEPGLIFSSKISYKSAIHNQTLVRAMKAQLDPSFLQGPPQRIYTVKVKFPRVIFIIWGTRNEWKNFFNGQIPIYQVKKAEG